MGIWLRRQPWRNWYRTGMAPVESLTDGGKFVSPAKPISGGVETWSEITPLSLCTVPKLTWNWPKFNQNSYRNSPCKNGTPFYFFFATRRATSSWHLLWGPVSDLQNTRKTVEVHHCFIENYCRCLFQRCLENVYPKISWRFVHPLFLRLFLCGKGGDLRCWKHLSFSGGVFFPVGA